MDIRKQNPIYTAFQLMRPKHYLKNVLLFISLVFSSRLFDASAFLRVLCGFAAFSLLSSAVYIINDIQDVETDRMHEVKRHRPIASGAIGIPSAYALTACCVIASAAINVGLMGMEWRSFSLLLTYLVVNLVYSGGGKNIPFLDIFLLVIGFLLRVLYGAVIIDESVSNWVSLTVISISFYLGLGKRRNELKKTNGQAVTRRVLQYYTFEFLDKFMYLCLSLAIVFYALWSADAAVIAKHNTDKLIWTVPFVILLMMKYSADVESDSYGDPVDVILHDKPLIAMGICYAVVILTLIYVPGI